MQLKHVFFALPFIASLHAGAAPADEARTAFVSHKTHCEQMLGGDEHEGDTPANPYSSDVAAVIRAHAGQTPAQVLAKLKEACTGKIARAGQGGARQVLAAKPAPGGSK